MSIFSKSGRKTKPNPLDLSKKVNLPPRSSDAISTEWNDICQKVGEITFSIKSLEAQLYGLQTRQIDLSQERWRRTELDKTQTIPDTIEMASQSVNS